MVWNIFAYLEKPKSIKRLRMEFILIVLLVVIIFMLNSIKRSLEERIRQTDVRLTELINWLNKTRPPEQASPVKEKTVTPPVEPPVIPPYVPDTTQEPLPKEGQKVAWQAKPIEEEFQKAENPAIPKSDYPKVPPKPGFFERNPDLEKFVGENLANKIGIGILVLGIGFFVKYAIDQNWINEIGRVTIGILAGGILLAIAHRMRNQFSGFSSVLVGGGIAVLYLTIAIAFHEYELFTQSAAFGIMVVITLFAVLFSLGYNRVELAVVAILGGFASPFMVSTGEGNYIILFTYILVLDIGMLILSIYKKWNIVNIICYVFTAILVGSWLGSRFDPGNPAMVGNGLLFSTSFFVVFFAMHAVNNIRSRKPFAALDYTLLLSNSFLYFAAGMIILKQPPWDDFRGLFTAGIGIFCFAFAYVLSRKDGVDKNLIYLMVGLVLTFTSLAAPIQLQGNHITMFWAAEAVVLLWLYQKSGITLIGLSSLIVNGLMIISLAMDWPQIYGTSATEVMPVLLNKGFATGIVSFISILLTLLLLRKQPPTVSWLPEYRMVLTLSAGVVLYTLLLLELRYQLQVFVDWPQTRSVWIGLYNMIYLIGILQIEKRLTLPDLVRNNIAFFGILGLLSYSFYYHFEVVAVRNSFLLNEASATGITGHYFLLVATLILSGLTLQRIRTLDKFNASTHNAYAWGFVLFYVFVASAELDHLVLLVGYSNPDDLHDLITQNHKIGYPIL